MFTIERTTKALNKKIEEAIANGTNEIDLTIKATGDNSAMVIATIVLSVVGVLGLAVRKESALAL